MLIYCRFLHQPARRCRRRHLASPHKSTRTNRQASIHALPRARDDPRARPHRIRPIRARLNHVPAGSSVRRKRLSMEQLRGHRLVLRRWSIGHRILIMGKTHWRSSYDPLFACQPTYCLLQRAERSGVGGGHPRGRSVSADLLPGRSRICARNKRSEYVAKHSKPVVHGNSVWVSGFVFRDPRKRVTTADDIPVQKVGYYLPFAAASSAISAVGNGLVSTFSPRTKTATWIGYQIILGGGRGIGMQTVRRGGFISSSGSNLTFGDRESSLSRMRCRRRRSL